jgi:hypothetical protein
MVAEDSEVNQKTNPMTAETLDGLIAEAKAKIDAQRAEVFSLYAGSDCQRSIYIAADSVAQAASYALDDLLAALRISSSQQDGEKVCALCGDFRRSSFPTLKTPAPRQTQEK